MISIQIDLQGTYERKGHLYFKDDIEFYVLKRKKGRARVPAQYLYMKAPEKTYISSLYDIPDSKVSYLFDFNDIQYVIIMTETGCKIEKRTETYEDK